MHEPAVNMPSPSNVLTLAGGQRIPVWTRIAAAIVVLLLEVSIILPLAHWMVTRMMARLSVISYLAGDDQWGFSRRLLEDVRRKRRRGELSRQYLRGWVSALLYASVHGPSRRRAAARRLGAAPPAFAIVSPSAACNLRCSHCYAATGVIPSRTVSLAEVARLVEGLEADGTSLVILSGGEPLVWRDHGAGLFELVARHPHLLFIVYTNGTLLDDTVARRMRELGNVLPLLSLEGLEPETDEVRGAGVYSAVRTAMARLARAGVLFGVSITASPRNWELLASSRFFQEIVDGAGASFIWMLELAPLGRAEQGAMLENDAREALQAALNREVSAGRLVVSFLHTSSSPTGCFGARRFDGFFYLDWDATVHRCVYQPALVAASDVRLDQPQQVEALLEAVAGLEACPLMGDLKPQQLEHDTTVNRR